MKAKTHKICGAVDCQKSFKLYKTTDKYCSLSCLKKTEKSAKTSKSQKIAFRKKSKKLSINEKIYKARRIVFLSKPENKVCRVFPHLPVTEIHHIKGRQGFADQYAIDNDLILLLDERYWLPVSRKGHEWIHKNDAEARKKGWLKSRLHN
jgi:hypothetical protein